MSHGHAKAFEVTLLCELLDVSRQSYDDWSDGPPSASSIQAGKIIAAIRLAHAESHCRYGSPNIHRYLPAKGLDCRIFLYLAGIEDPSASSGAVLFSCRIIGWAMKDMLYSDLYARSAGDGPGETPAETSGPASF